MPESAPLPEPAGDAVTVAWLEGQADAIRRLASRSSRDIIEIGQRLIDAKDRLDHGQFLPWVDREFGWSQQTASNFMRVARYFGDKVPTIGAFDASALYALASGTVPQEIREQFIAQAEAGEPLRYQEVRAAIAATRPAPELPAATPNERPPRIVREPVREPEPDYDRGDGWFDGLAPEAQASAIGLHQVAVEAGAPAVVARDITRASLAIAKADRFLGEVGEARVREMIPQYPDLDRTLRDCIADCNRLADHCRRILGEQGPALRRIV